jgi:bifunctional DNA-binding transcriptional regulator/antitoxin component of YhaV-PrlF toxin-antitoxin module
VPHLEALSRFRRDARAVAFRGASGPSRVGGLAVLSLLPYFPPMLAKLTAKNQLTVPKRALDALGLDAPPTYFELEVNDGRIVLTPARIGSGEPVRRKLAELGITDADVVDAVAWARRRP